MDNQEKEPIKILIVGADHEQIRKTLERIRSGRHKYDPCPKILIDVMDPNDPNESVRDRMDNLSFSQRMNEMFIEQAKVSPTLSVKHLQGYESYVRTPRNQRIPHRQRGDKRKYPH